MKLNTPDTLAIYTLRLNHARRLRMESIYICAKARKARAAAADAVRVAQESYARSKRLQDSHTRNRLPAPQYTLPDADLPIV